jgi:hypothetical protein
MANFNKCVPENVPGEFFVDSTCIDCDTCRQLARLCGRTDYDMQPVYAEVAACVSRGGKLYLRPREVVLHVATPAHVVCPRRWPVAHMS